MLMQGIVLLVAGMGMVVSFLSLLVLIMWASSKIIPRFNHILPDEAPRTRAPRAKVPKQHAPHGADGSDAEVAVALAAVMAHQRAAEKG